MSLENLSANDLMALVEQLGGQLAYNNEDIWMPVGDVAYLAENFADDLMNVTGDLERKLPMGEFMVILEEYGADLVNATSGAVSEKEMMSILQQFDTVLSNATDGQVMSLDEAIYMLGNIDPEEIAGDVDLEMLMEFFMQFNETNDMPMWNDSISDWNDTM